MPSSLIFAGLALAWLVVLVPMVAKRRQEVVRTTESALASRVLHRSGPWREDDEEVSGMVDRYPRRDPGPRPYRPGRGGYDAEGAAVIAQARYVMRQRIVLGLIAAAVVTLVLAFVLTPTMWWAHAAVDVSLVGYLGYLRRQVRIEEEVRHRRAARIAAARRRAEEESLAYDYDDAYESADSADSADDAYESYEDGYEDDVDEPEVPQRRSEPVRRAEPRPVLRPGIVAVDVDDEDPAFDYLDGSFEPRYRRAVGE